MDGPADADLTDGVIALGPLEATDAAEHLAGEDAELVRWLNGGPGTPSTVRAHIEQARAMWAAGGPIFTFGIRIVAGNVLVGTVDVQLHQPYTRDGQANLAFGLYPAWRGQGLATRAVQLALRFLRDGTHVEQPSSASTRRTAGPPPSPDAPVSTSRALCVRTAVHS